MKTPALFVLFLVGCGGSSAAPKAPAAAATEPAPSAPSAPSDTPAKEASAAPSEAGGAPAEASDAPACKDAACAKACDAKKTVDVCEAAMSYYEGLEVDSSKIGENSATELKYAKIACDLGSAFACTKGGDLTIAGFGEFIDEKKYPQSLALYEKACELKNPFACHLAARQYTDGKGTKKDPAKAFALEVKSCRVGKFPEQDCKEIRTALGKKDKSAIAAVDALRKQCKGGDAAACETEKRIDAKK